MKNYPLRKIYKHKGKDWASIRDYAVRECLERQESLCATFGEEKMVLTPDQLKNYEQFTPELITSNFKDSCHPSYYLYDYPWEPERQGRLNLFRVK